jgi:glycopeptide antibiotics resistance protein
MVIAVTRLPARTGFRLTWPACDLRLTLENVGLSLTKVPHIVLFGAFFLLTVVQFDQLDRRALAWSLVATAMLSMLIEFQQGATRTGNCRLTDVAPNLLGALIVAALGIAALGIRHRLRVQPNVASRR